MIIILCEEVPTNHRISVTTIKKLFLSEIYRGTISEHEKAIEGPSLKFQTLGLFHIEILHCEVDLMQCCLKVELSHNVIFQVRLDYHTL